MTDLLALEAAYLDRIRAAGLSGALIRDITAQLIGNPFVTAASVARATGKTTAGARNAIGQLIGLGVLRERTTRSYARVYEAVEVFQILQRP
ncbi:hypothetical protein MXD59_23630 [Frankia sp. Ag45/Mut15]|uniref:Uncharacterized protein n=1 Tax=Frankia umida TaxID=573489 RepID=A0ABT0K4I8_9ACTN|nr:hypothetical protein [Frankia umida]MCK9878715.1 hypothetical protein [Frankia umida]